MEPLNLASKGIVKIPQTLENLPSVVAVDISGNDITSGWEYLLKCHSLKRVILDRAVYIKMPALIKNKLIDKKVAIVFANQEK